MITIIALIARRVSVAFLIQFTACRLPAYMSNKKAMEQNHKKGREVYILLKPFCSSSSACVQFFSRYFFIITNPQETKKCTEKEKMLLFGGEQKEKLECKKCNDDVMMRNDQNIFHPLNAAPATCGLFSSLNACSPVLIPFLSRYGMDPLLSSFSESMCEFGGREEEQALLSFFL